MMKDKDMKAMCGTPCPVCSGMCRFGKGLGLLVVGLLFLAKNRGWMSMSLADTLWPLVLVVLGAGFVMKGLCKCCMK